MTASFNEIRETFALLDDWEDRYRYVIDLGRDLEPLADVEKTDATKVRGCASQVWLVSRLDGEPPVVRLRGDSDAHIVKGLIAVLLMLYSGKTPNEIVAVDARAELGALGLEEHLSPMRTNGLFSMVERIRALANDHMASA
ncbi:MAG: SufE family protein [Sphingomonadales bacterium]